MLYEIALKDNSPYLTYCPRPLIQGDVRAYRVTLKTEQSLEGCSVMATALRSDGQTVKDIGDVYGSSAEYTLAENMYAIEGEMRLLIAVVGYDGSTLTAKEIIFSVVPGGDNDFIDGDDRVPALNSLMGRCTDLLDECEYLKSGYKGIISSHNNLFNPQDVTFVTAVTGVVTLTGLTGSEYSLNFEPITATASDGSALDVTKIGDDHYIVSANGITDGTMTIGFSGYLDYEHFMIIEGRLLPERFKPYGTDEFINDDLLSSVYNAIEYSSQVISPVRAYKEDILYLQPNRIYNIDLGEYKDFRLPDVPSDSYAQILVQATVNNEDSVVWGTQYFFGGETPYITPGRYNFIWEHDNGIWYAGAILKTAGETV